mmetsp:Transcript_15818/g.21706  ORF Transcript_15818/g.21706 Transcript_15818/m.21706 type:complete len:194 (-) Transcript_15818:358-939(-)|eukprot:CAMPEP_0185725122 /NCGR_PEP_ID=MMETSP1171-20130828/1446_1 /TAXON_ID=374046 /ORGANISM="Helicotheca tamensis, Strain CCMP826" /LENGTH=193 /DNA_ID=CAMNT_0028393159 /DNA_START=142 /DNA_END=723 /DNA_ORIENTATION=+
MWTSKLGTKYPQKEIESSHPQNLAILAKLRNEPSNRACADCGQEPTVWSSVNIGVFTCLRCGSLHRALGTHISKPKGCTGTYLWGPDEIAQMQEMGNERANSIYGGVKERPHNDASHEQWLEFLRDKYERRKFIPKQQQQQQHGVDKNMSKSVGNKKRNHAVATQDLLGLETKEMQLPGAEKTNIDFFAQFGV